MVDWKNAEITCQALIITKRAAWREPEQWWRPVFVVCLDLFDLTWQGGDQGNNKTFSD